MAVRYVHSTMRDVCDNLALEEYLFYGTSGRWLLTWVDDPCVVVGRHQNPWAECAVREVTVARRMSGGGTVYHDGGNLNFSFIAARDDLNLDATFAVVVEALAACGVPARRTERNDLYVGDRKVSGNAFRHARGRSIHHGTLLVDSDLDRLRAALTGDPRVRESRAIDSVRATVVALRAVRPDVTVDAVRSALAATGARWADDDRPDTFGVPAEVAALPGFPEAREARRRHDSWEWRFGTTPRFTYRLDAEGVALVVDRGLVTDVVAPAGMAATGRSAAERCAALVGARFDPALALTAARGQDTDQ